MKLRLPLAAMSAILIVLLIACSSNEPQTGAAQKTPDRDPATTSGVQASTPSSAEATQADVPSETPQVASSDGQAASLIQFTATDLTGQARSSVEWMGKQPVVINFWGTWCPPCRKEIPDLVKVYNEFKGRGVQVVSLALNDTPDQVKDYAQKAQMDWVMLMGDQDIAQTFGGIRGVPTTIFYDRSGKEVGRFVGGRDYETFKKAFEMIAGS